MIKSKVGFYKLMTLVLSWRGILFIAVAVGGQFLSFRTDFTYTKLSYYLSTPLSPVQVWLEPWANFDGVHYLNIARRGYVDEGRFLPLLPILLSSWRGEVILSFVFTQLITCLAVYALYRLLLLDYSQKIALKTILLLMVFPTSFFFGAIYTEGLFLLLVVLSFYSARKSWWWLTGICTFLLMLTRLVGMVMLPVLLVEWRQQHQKNAVASIYKIIPLIISPIGLLSFSWFNHQKWQDWLYFLHAHTELGNSRSSFIVNPLRVGFRYFKILTQLNPQLHEWKIALLELATFIFISTLLVIAWKKKIKTSYLLYSGLAFLMPVLSGTWTGLPRYVLILFPLFIVLAQLENRWIRWTYVVICLPMLVLLAVLFSQGYFIA